MAARKQIVQRVLSGSLNLFQNRFGYRLTPHLIKHNGNHRVFRLLREQHFSSSQVVSNKDPYVVERVKRLPKRLDSIMIKLSEHQNDENVKICDALESISDFKDDINELQELENEDDFLLKLDEIDYALPDVEMKITELYTELDKEIDDKLQKVRKDKRNVVRLAFACVVSLLFFGAIDVPES